MIVKRFDAMVDELKWSYDKKRYVANRFLYFFNIFRRKLQDQKFILHVLHKEMEEKTKDDVCFQFMLNYVTQLDCRLIKLISEQKEFAERIQLLILARRIR